MIYLDQRGSGRSASAPRKSYGLDRLVLGLEELRQQLHLEKLPAATRPPLDASAPLPQRVGLVSALLGQHRLQNRLMYAHDSTAARLAHLKPAQPANRDFAAGTSGWTRSGRPPRAGGRA